MASFTSAIKKDLLGSVPEERSARLALWAGFLDTSGSYSFGTDSDSDGFSFTSETEDVAEYFLAIAEKIFGISMTLTEARRDPKHGRNKLTFSYYGESAFDYADETSDYSACNLTDEKDMLAYLKGAFLGGGSCTLPRGGVKTGYHLEFVFSSAKDAVAFCEMLDGLQLFVSMIQRSEKHVVYLKSREGISDFLYSVGANTALKRLEEVSAAREESNNFNRISNCYAGNADKAVMASAAQALAIRKLKERGGFSKLPPPLRRLADDRIENPTFSLAELAETEGVSKSCLNHRMRKLMTICDKTEE